MADSEKKISFRGVDQGAGDMMNQLRQKSQELGQAMIENARKSSSSSKDFISNLREQISLEEKRIRLREQAQKYEAKETYRQESQSEDIHVRNQAKENYQESVQNIESESEQEKLQTDLLRELVQETKERARQETQEDREAAEKRASQVDEFIGQGAKEPESGDEKEVLKRSFEKQQLDKEDTENKFQSLKEGMDNTLQQAPNAIADPIGTMKEVIGSQGKNIPVLGGLAAGGAALGAYGLQRGQGYQKAAGELTGATGFNYMESDRPTNPLTDIGIKNKELFEYTQNLSRTRGYGTEGYTTQGDFGERLDPTKEAGRLMTQEKAFGLDQGFLSGLSKYQSFDTNSRSTSGDVLDLVNTFRGQGQAFTNEDESKIDFSRLPELLETQNELAMQQVQHLGEINMSTNANIISAFSDVGGQFDNPLTQKKLVTGIDQSLRNPQNKFQKAFDYSTIRDMDSDAGYLEVQKAQEKGLAYTSPEEGNDSSRLGQTLRNMQKRFGDNQKALELGIQGRFGDQVSYSQGEQLAQAYQENPDIFRGISSKEEAFRKADVDQEDVKNKAVQQRSDIESALATLDNTASSVGAQMTERLDEMIQTLKDKLPDRSSQSNTKSTSSAKGNKAEEELKRKNRKLLQKDFADMTEKEKKRAREAYNEFFATDEDGEEKK